MERKRDGTFLSSSALTELYPLWNVDLAVNLAGLAAHNLVILLQALSCAASLGSMVAWSPSLLQPWSGSNLCKRRKICAWGRELGGDLGGEAFAGLFAAGGVGRRVISSLVQPVLGASNARQHHLQDDIRRHGLMDGRWRRMADKEAPRLRKQRKLT